MLGKDFATNSKRRDERYRSAFDVIFEDERGNTYTVRGCLSQYDAQSIIDEYMTITESRPQKFMTAKIIETKVVSTTHRHVYTDTLPGKCTVCWKKIGY